MEVAKPITLDLLDVKAPALSSTDDLPKVETKPDASPAAPAKTEVVEEGKTVQVESATTPDEPSASDEPKKAKGVQKRLDELTREREEARRLAEAERQEKLRLLSLLESKNKEPEKPVAKEDEGPVRPKRADFADRPDDYDAALDDYVAEKSSWQAKKEVTAVLGEEKRKADEQKSIESQAAAREAYAARRQKALEKYPDYQEVAESPDVMVSQHMAYAIMHLENGPDIAQHLGKNPAEAKRISELPPPLQLYEIGLITAKLSAPEAKELKKSQRPRLSPSLPYRTRRNRLSLLGPVPKSSPKLLKKKRWRNTRADVKRN